MNEAFTAGPNPPEAHRQALADEEHLKLLSLGYLISGAMTAFFSIFGLFYAAMGLFFGAMIRHQRATGGAASQPPPAFIGWFFAIFGLGFFVYMAVVSVLKFRAAYCLKRRKSRIFCMVVAGISCLEVPYGTAIGVLTSIVLGRASVVRLFEPAAAPPAAF